MEHSVALRGRRGSSLLTTNSLSEIAETSLLRETAVKLLGALEAFLSLLSVELSGFLFTGLFVEELSSWSVMPLQDACEGQLLHTNFFIAVGVDEIKDLSNSLAAFSSGFWTGILSDGTVGSWFSPSDLHTLQLTLLNSVRIFGSNAFLHFVDDFLRFRKDVRAGKREKCSEDRP